MRCKATFVMIAVLAAAWPAASQEISESAVFPVVARTAGSGSPPTRWVTDLTVANVNDYSLRVGMKFLPADQANQPVPTFAYQVTLSPHQTRRWIDVLSSVFGYDTDIKGALWVSCSEDFFPTNPEDSDMLASTRTYNTGSPEGTYGQTIPVTGRSYNPFPEPSFVTGARNDAQYRSNLGITNLSPGGVTIHYRILDADGVVVVEGQKAMPSATVSQWSFTQLGVGQVQGPLTVELWMDAADLNANPCSEDQPNMFMAYVSKVDGNPDGTGDAEFLYAAPTRPFSWCDTHD